MNMYLHEVRSFGKATVIWTCAMIALAAIYFSVYPGVEKDATGFRELLGNYPASVRAMLGISLDNITSLLGFYSMVFTFITLCGAIQATIFGASVLSKETSGKTADFLMVKPVSRTAIINAKLLAVLTMILATDLIYFGAVSMFANSVKPDYSHKLFLMVNATMFFIQLIFLALGLLASVIIPRLKSVLSVSLGIVFGLFFIGALITTGDKDMARLLSPFQYFDNLYIIRHARYEVLYLLASLAIIIVAITASYAIYIRKDIHAIS
ncbi:MAG: ABC transporter permease subunit [Ignavibacteriales bacterium]